MWESILKHDLQDAVQGDAYWKSILDSMASGRVRFGLHLAVMVQPYLKYIIEGKKTVESRFSERRIAPYGNVNIDDIILLKKTGGPIVGICQISNIWYYPLDTRSWQKIRSEFYQMLCAQDPEFWNQRKSARFATLMSLKNVLNILPVRYSKKDRRGWVVLKPSGG